MFVVYKYTLFLTSPKTTETICTKTRKLHLDFSLHCEVYGARIVLLQHQRSSQIVSLPCRYRRRRLHYRHSISSFRGIAWWSKDGEVLYVTSLDELFVLFVFYVTKQ